MLAENKIHRISGILKDMPNLVCAYLHGSALTEYFQGQSDIDIALLFSPGFRPVLADIIESYHAPIESSIYHIPHFGILSSKDVVFSKEVVTRGTLIVCNDSYLCKSFTMHTLSMYIILNAERKKILEQYAA
jgi:predicted nucleotidyltransferase